MKNTNRIILVLLSALFLLGVCGCMKRGQYPGNDEMVAYLESKYDDSFTYYGPASGDLRGKSKQIYCTSVKFPDYLTWVKYDAESGVYTENYLCVRYHAQAEALLNSTLAQALPENQYAYLSGTMGNGVSMDGASEETTFEEFISDRKSALSMIAIVQLTENSTDRSELKENIRCAVLESGMYLVSCEVFFTESDQYSGAMSDSEYSKFVAGGDYEQRCSLELQYETDEQVE